MESQFLFIPDFKIRPDDYNVLVAADGRNPDGRKAWLVSHLKMQVKEWPLGGCTSWDVEVLEAGAYAANVLYRHNVHFPLRVTVTAGQTCCETVAGYDPADEWRRLPLEGTLDLEAGKHTIRVSLAAADDSGRNETIELHSVELVKPGVKERLHQAAMKLREQADTAWFRKAGYGLMLTWTSCITPRRGAKKNYADAVDAFPVEQFADQAAATGASFIVFSTSHAEMYFPAPLTSLERILPGRTTRRDLVAELAMALERRGMRLFLYYHLGAESDPLWLESSGFKDTDTRRFWDNWTAVIGEAGERYGTRLSGWWFDDGTGNYYYRSAPWERLAHTAKLGNPRRLICFNPWILPSATEFEDYLAGENNTDASLGGKLRPGMGGRLGVGLRVGLQASSAIRMEGDWDHRALDTDISPPRYSLEQTVKMIRDFRALENVMIFNLEIYQDGLMSEATVELLRKAKRLAEG